MDGYSAYHDGYSRMDNPFLVGTHSYGVWMEAFDEAARVSQESDNAERALEAEVAREAAEWDAFVDTQIEHRHAA